MRVSYGIGLLEMGCIAFKFASVWDCKICISKWINVKCLEREIKTVRLPPDFMSVWWKWENFNSKDIWSIFKQKMSVFVLQKDVCYNFTNRILCRNSSKILLCGVMNKSKLQCMPHVFWKEWVFFVRCDFNFSPFNDPSLYRIATKGLEREHTFLSKIY